MSSRRILKVLSTLVVLVFALTLVAGCATPTAAPTVAPTKAPAAPTAAPTKAPAAPTAAAPGQGRHHGRQGSS